MDRWGVSLGSARSRPPQQPGQASAPPPTPRVATLACACAPAMMRGSIGISYAATGLGRNLIRADSLEKVHARMHPDRRASVSRPCAQHQEVVVRAEIGHQARFSSSPQRTPS